MSNKAWAYIAIVCIIAGGVTILSFERISIDPTQVTPFLLLTFLATAAQFYKSEAPTHQLYHPALIFYFAAAITLDGSLFISLIIISHMVEWVKERWSKREHLHAWYIQPFNISMHIIVGLGAKLTYELINPIYSAGSPSGLLAGISAALVYTLLNHLIIGQALILAWNGSWKEFGILQVENLTTDLGILLMGFIAAVLLSISYWLVLPILPPLYLINRAFALPKLKQMADSDPKTGLWNNAHFNRELEEELKRAKRYNRPLTVVMADLDFLRHINNTYGHLAGDAVLIGIAQILNEHFRDYDLAARFGGEEFSIMLPETNSQTAFARIENIRKIVEASEFEAPTTHAKLKATMSFGIAVLDNADLSAQQLIHLADIAVYHAKREGRNRTTIYSEKVAESLDLIEST